MAYVASFPRRPSSGLCNQLLNMVLCIETGARTSRVAALGPFMPNFNADLKIPVEKILDIEATNKILKEEGQPTQIGKVPVHYFLLSRKHVFDGKRRRSVEERHAAGHTCIFVGHYMTPVGVPKVWSWLRFQPVFYKVVEEFCHENPGSWVTVHLRGEGDVARRYGTKMGLSPDEFVDHLLQKYITLMKTFPPKTQFFVSTGLPASHTAFKTLQSNFKILHTSSEEWKRKIRDTTLLDGREVFGLIDLLIGSLGTHLLGFRDSSMSWVLAAKIKKSTWITI